MSPSPGTFVSFSLRLSSISPPMTTVWLSWTSTVVSIVRLFVTGRVEFVPVVAVARRSRLVTSSESFRRTLRPSLTWGVIFRILPTSRYSKDS